MSVNFCGLSIAGAKNQENLNKLYGNPEYKKAAMDAFKQIDAKSGNTDVFLETTNGKCQVKAMDGTKFIGYQDKDYVDLSIVDSNGEVISEQRMFYTPNKPDSDLTESNFQIFGKFFPDLRHTAKEYQDKCDFYA